MRSVIATMVLCVIIILLIPFVSAQNNTCGSERHFLITYSIGNETIKTLDMCTDEPDIIVNIMYSMDRIAFHRIPTKAKSLTINKNNITEIPRYTRRTNLKTLNFSDNALRRIGNLNTFRDIKHVNLRYNKIKIVPRINLAKLESIDLGYNRIKTIEKQSFEFARSLKFLQLQENNLREATVCIINTQLNIDVTDNNIVSFFKNIRCINCRCTTGTASINCNNPSACNMNDTRDLEVTTKSSRNFDEKRDINADQAKNVATIYISIGSIVTIFLMTIFIGGTVYTVKRRAKRSRTIPLEQLAENRISTQQKSNKEDNENLYAVPYDHF